MMAIKMWVEEIGKMNAKDVIKTQNNGMYKEYVEEGKSKTEQTDMHWKWKN